ncbi:L,D-transpeptidase family protein [Echinimonas agarilytica]|uniref:L,D-transpeptidase family protein n=1 Tax=Echinimonas agarilytica TaxID=1215918 RepID=A0AA41W703_9GAMM|nr:L,D-transpeptidase family protein [Echinimonas agarilytica]MCM2680250.1 L,D-transpeptidase family protein [Echinimonas agarilytica]
MSQQSPDIWRHSELQQEIRQLVTESSLAFGTPAHIQILDNIFNYPTAPEVYADAALYLSAIQRHFRHANYTEQMKLTLSVHDARANALELSMWNDAMESNSAIQIAHKLRPPHPWYASYRQAIVQLLSQSAAPWPHIEEGPLFDLNSQDNRTQQVHLILERWKLKGTSGLQQFQQIHGLKVDGIIGQNTRYWLNMSPVARAIILARNSQRLHAAPNTNFQNTVWVNVPSFELNYWRYGEHQIASRVIVGKKSRKTPMLISHIDQLIANPAWNVPYRIMRYDILPKAQNDPSYLAERGFRVINSDRSYRAETVPLESFDWPNVTILNFPFLLQQAPGKNNALGSIKFNFPNRYRVYLHDTNQPELFENHHRALSSGCIRVEKAQQLAELLMSPSQNIKWTQWRESMQTSDLRPEQNAIIQITYLTAWPEKNGEFSYRNDIYQYDASSLKMASNWPKALVMNDNNGLTNFSPTRIFSNR